MNTKFTFRGTEYDLNDILSQEDFWSKEDVDKPIIGKSGIDKLCDKFNLTISETDTKTTYAGEPYKFIITVVIKMHYFSPQDGNFYFYGDGEANALNLSDKISKSYPLALAIKRAKSRAVITFLGIQAFGEDEASSFSKDPLLDAKKLLMNEIKAAADQLNPPITKAELSNIVKEECGVTDLKFSTVSVKGLLAAYKKVLTL